VTNPRQSKYLLQQSRLRFTEFRFTEARKALFDATIVAISVSRHEGSHFPSREGTDVIEEEAYMINDNIPIVTCEPAVPFVTRVCKGMLGLAARTKYPQRSGAEDY